MKAKRLMTWMLLTSIVLGSTTPLVQATEVTTSTSSVATTTSTNSAEPVETVSSSLTTASTTALSDSTSEESNTASSTTPSSTTLPSATETEQLDLSSNLEKIIGTDDQYWVNDATVAPYNSVVRLLIEQNGGYYVGSGVVIAPNLILTVAHNVYDRDTQSWADRVVAIPAKNGPSEPYGRFTSTHYYVLREYLSQNIWDEFDYDIAVLKLDSSIPSTVPALSVTTNFSDSDRIQIPGFPAVSSHKSGYMYTSFGSISNVWNKQIGHLVDTEPGNSGSPILNNRNQIIAMHSSGHSTENYGRRVDQDVLDMIRIARTNDVLTNTVTSNRNTAIAPTSVTVTPSSQTLTVGSTATLTATVSPSNATNKSVTWTSSNPKVATVSNGKVTAVAPGTATITVRTASGNKTATATIIVKTKTIVPTKVSLTPSSQTLTVGSTATLTATVSPSNATNKSVTWTSSNPKVATVSNGKVTAVAPGTATITVRTASGNKTATATIIVKAKTTPVSTVSLYRLYHPGLKVHLYTKDMDEYTVLATRGWQQEGVAWTTALNRGESVYRLYHPGLRVHFYTKDVTEYTVLATRGWQQEGEAFRSYGNVPIYRLYHPGVKKHLYTKDVDEYTFLATRGWQQEGIAFYAVK